MVKPQKDKNTDVDAVIAIVVGKLAAVRTDQLRVKHPTDDDGLWFFTSPASDTEVQIESSTGQCPFLIESSANHERNTSNTVEATAGAVVRLLEKGASGHD